MTRLGTITPEGNVQWEPTQEQQDALDGAALRKFEAALPEGWTWGLWPRRRGYHIVAADTKHILPEPVMADGKTIAEAADAAREALEARE